MKPRGADLEINVSRVPHCHYVVDNNQYSRFCVIRSYWSSLIGRPLGAVAPIILSAALRGFQTTSYLFSAAHTVDWF